MWIICEGVREMDFRIYGALITLKNTGTITREKFVEEWHRNQRRLGIVPMPATKYLMGPQKRASFFQRICRRFEIGRFAK
jgi:hypothetical protein